MEQYLKEMKNTLEEVYQKIESNKIAIAFSGGIDSSIIAFQANLIKKKIKLYTVGTENSFDIKNSKNIADLLDMNLKNIIIDKKDIEHAIPILSKIIGNSNVVQISYELPLFFVTKDSDENHILSGQGADEIFGGYAKYLDVDNNILSSILEEDIKKLKGGINEKHIAEHFRKKLIIPFLSPKFVEYCINIPPELKIKYGIRKYILREFGRSVGLPEIIVEREKKAAQYSSGIMKEIKLLAKENKSNVQDYINKIIE